MTAETEHGWRSPERRANAKRGIDEARRRLEGVPYCEGCGDYTSVLVTETLCIDCSDEENEQ
jgi:hypothetical protein